MNIVQVGSCTAIELVGDCTNSSNENTFLEREQNESLDKFMTRDFQIQLANSLKFMLSIMVSFSFSVNVKEFVFST
jgi:hypothetical protein